MSFTAEVMLVERLGDGLVVLRYGGHTRSPREAIWSRAKTRKPTHCIVTGEPLDKGTEAYRPIGNQDYRSRRIGAWVIDNIGGIKT